jgi:hypothetical protein
MEEETVEFLAFDGETDKIVVYWKREYSTVE